MAGAFMLGPFVFGPFRLGRETFRQVAFLDFFFRESIPLGIGCKVLAHLDQWRRASFCAVLAGHFACRIVPFTLPKVRVSPNPVPATKIPLYNKDFKAEHNARLLSFAVYINATSTPQQKNRIRTQSRFISSTSEAWTTPLATSAVPVVERRIAHAILAARLGHRLPTFGLMQYRKDLHLSVSSCLNSFTLNKVFGLRRRFDLNRAGFAGGSNF